MAERAYVPDALDIATLDIATQAFWNPPSLDAQLSHVKPWGKDESFAIEDLTDEEWQSFVEALKE